MVDLTGRGGLEAAAREAAVLVPQPDRVPDARGDILAIADVQGQAGAAEAGAELAAAQERRQPARTRQQVDCLADDRLLQGLPAALGRRHRAVTAAAGLI